MHAELNHLPLLQSTVNNPKVFLQVGLDSEVKKEQNNTICFPLCPQSSYYSSCKADIFVLLRQICSFSFA